MKWFKHYSDALDDPFIQSLLDKFFHTGYIVWFGLIEIITKENGTNITGKLDIDPVYLRRKLRTSEAKLKRVFSYCQASAKLSVTFGQELWSFHFHKIQEIKDNYSKDLQGACKKLAHYKEAEKEQYKEEQYKEEEKKIVKKRILKLSDEEWIQELKINPAYKGINIEIEHSKCIAWFDNKGITVSRQRFLNWLNRADKPLKKGEAYDTERKNNPDAYSNIGRPIE